MEKGAGVGQFWTPILAKGGSFLHADSHRDKDNSHCEVPFVLF